MNHKKLLRRNLSLPISERISHSDIQNQIKLSKSRVAPDEIQERIKYQAKINLIQQIHSEIKDKIDALWKAEETMSKIGSISFGCYTGERRTAKALGSTHDWGESESLAYSMGKIVSDVAAENEPAFAFVKSGMNKAEDITRTESNSEYQRENNLI